MSKWEIDIGEGQNFWLVTESNIEQCRVVGRGNFGNFKILLQRGDDHDGVHEAESEAHHSQLFKLSDIEGVRQRMREFIGTTRAELVKFEESHGIGQTYGDFVGEACSTIRGNLQIPNSVADRIERITTIDGDTVIDMKNAEPHGYSQTYVHCGQLDIKPSPEVSRSIEEIKSLRRRATSIKPIIALPWGTVWFHYIDSDGKVIGTTVRPPNGCEMICASVSDGDGE